LIENFQEDFSFIYVADIDAKDKSKTVLAYYTLTAVPIFNNDHDDAIKLSLLSNDEYMLAMPSVVKKFIFIVLVS
jgi:hypothetical protein